MGAQVEDVGYSVLTESAGAEGGELGWVGAAEEEVAANHVFGRGEAVCWHCGAYGRWRWAEVAANVAEVGHALNVDEGWGGEVGGEVDGEVGGWFEFFFFGWCVGLGDGSCFGGGRWLDVVEGLIGGILW